MFKSASARLFGIPTLSSRTMPNMSISKLGPTQFPWLIILALLCFAGPAHAFGAGTILKSSKLKDSFWRHGDIAEVMFGLGVEELFVRRVYFGNWLCDFSQGLDAGTLSRVPRPIIQAIISILAYMEFGFTTKEFEVTPERLGVYRPEIHIDNPKGYPVDANEIDADLRGPVSDHELSINPGTGMKNYIASPEGFQKYETSRQKIGLIFQESILLGRKAKHCEGEKGKDEDRKAAEYESLRLLGTVLHTLEDFMAHSNYLELALAMITGYPVFSYVGDAAFIDMPVEAALAERWVRSTKAHTHGEPGMVGEQTPNIAFQASASTETDPSPRNAEAERTTTKFPPLITGTFGVLDFLETVTGAISDHAAARNLSDLTVRLPELDAIDSAVNAFFVVLKSLLALPGFGLGDLDLSALVNRSKGEAKKPRSWGDWEKAPGEFYESIKPILILRDTIAREVLHQLEKIPLVRKFLSEISSALDKFVFALMAPFLKPVIVHVQSLLSQVARDITEAQIDDRELLFTPGSTFSDPSHALLCKDHFTNQLNPLAGFVSSYITEFTVKTYLAALTDPNIPIQIVVDNAMSVLHHPMLPSSPKTEIQEGMFVYVQKWWNAHGPVFQQQLLGTLSREGVERRLNHGIVNPPDSHSHSHSHSNSGPTGEVMYFGKKRIDEPSALNPNPVDSLVSKATNLVGKGVLDVIQTLTLGGEDGGEKVPMKGLGPIQGMGNLLKDGMNVLETLGDDDDGGANGGEDGRKKKDSTMGKMMEKFGGMMNNEAMVEKGRLKRAEAGAGSSP